MPHRAKKKVDWDLRFKKGRQPSSDSSSEEQSKYSGFGTIFGVFVNPALSSWTVCWNGQDQSEDQQQGKCESSVVCDFGD